MATPSELPELDLISRLDTLESDLHEAVDRALAPALRLAARSVPTPVEASRRNARVAQRLREARAPIVEAITVAMVAAVELGIDDAQQEQPPNPEHEEPDPSALLSDVDVNSDIRSALIVVGAAVASGVGDIADRVISVANAIHVQVITRVIDAYNRAKRWYARRHQFDLLWVTVGDRRVCPICSPLSGKTVASTEAFSSDEATFSGVFGQPPAHPRCRCYLQVQQR